MRCHLTYCLLIWGGKPSGKLTELKTALKRIWSKIGQRRIHTNARLVTHGMFKLEDELALSEIKMVWRWSKNKLPEGLKYIIKERVTRQLRHRQFENEVRWKPYSISRRLANKAKKYITEIDLCNTKLTLKNRFKKQFSATYAQPCNTRNCYICSNINQ